MRQRHHKQRQRRNDHADAGNRQTRLRVRHEQHDRQQEYGSARAEGSAVRDGAGRLRADDRPAVRVLLTQQLLAEAQPEINGDSREADRDDRAGIFDEVKERIAKRSADDDVRRVAAHGRRAAEVRAEDLREDHRHGVELHRLRQLERDGGEKEHDRDAVDEHRKHRRKAHEADEQRHHMVVNELCERQAQPAEEARLTKPLDHDHHARDEENGGPVDARRALLARPVPEGQLKKRAKVERFPYRCG